MAAAGGSGGAGGDIAAAGGSGGSQAGGAGGTSTKWVVQDSGSAKTLYDVHAIDASTAVAVGDQGWILRTEDGHKWSKVDGGTSAALRAVHFHDAQNGCAAGDWLVLQTKDGGKSWAPVSVKVGEETYVYTGVASRVQVGCTPVAPESFFLPGYDIVFAATTHAWVVGTGGKIYSPLDLKPQASTTTNDLYRVVAADTALVMAVGKLGTIVRTINGGTSWTVANSGTSEPLRAVDFITKLDAIAVGDNGTVVATHSAGASWQPEASNTKVTLRGVSFAGKIGWAVGDAGTIVRRDTN